LSLGLSQILGGALGNLLDRVRLGYVVDFLDVHHQFTIVDYNFMWPKFNIADISILLGVGLFLYDMILEEKQRRALEQSEAS
jgi:signal peptidase II